MPKPTDEFTKAVGAALEDYRRMFTNESGGYMDKEQALASIQASTVKLLERMKEIVSMKRTMFLTKEDVANNLEQANRDVRVRDRLRQEINEDIDQLIKDLSSR